MENNISLLQKNSLFAGIEPNDIQKMCKCLAMREKTFAKDSFVFRAGDDVRFVYINLSGMVHIVDEDFLGNRSLIESIQPNTLFGEAYALTSAGKHLVSVVAAEDAAILEIDPGRLFESCPNGCECHMTLMRNTACILSEKIVRLTEKLGHIVKRTTREKILSYLSGCARLAQSDSFNIPYSRQQLADYLCVDRSALSHELGRMQREGVVQYRKNHFELLRPK